MAWHGGLSGVREQGTHPRGHPRNLGDPCVSAHEVPERRTGWLLEVDIQGFFDNLDRAHLRSFLEQRVRDGVIRRLIDKWLKAGVLEGESWRQVDKGTPQGGGSRRSPYYFSFNRGSVWSGVTHSCVAL